MKNLTGKEKRIICITLSCWGIILIGSGLIMSTANRTITKKNYSLEITHKKVAEAKTNEIKLKDMTLEINTPLSVDIKDYLENIEELDEGVIKALKLDTSAVNINEAGTYTYTVSFKKKKYNGTFIIKEKELPKTEITLKNIRLAKNSALSTSLSTYVVETLTEEVKNNITLDLSAVNTTQLGDYQYSVIYDGKMYTATITIYEPHTTVITPNQSTEDEKEQTKDNTVSDEKTNTETETTPELTEQ